jgi:tRNA threonylcarbamoyladenosine biosynthesis protein TsaE
MNTGQTLQMHSTSSESTERLGEAIGAKLRGGEIIELVSDLGGGKTTFTRGLVRGAGSDDRVASPTFTISREYHTASFTIAHFDFYRLDEAGIVAAELEEAMGDTHTVVVVEWGDVVRDVLPEHRLTITIKLDAASESARDITITYPEHYRYLLETA